MKSIRSPFKGARRGEKDIVPPRIVTDDDPVMEDREDREEERVSPVDRFPANDRYAIGSHKEDLQEVLSTVREEPSMEEEEREESEEDKEAEPEGTTAPAETVVKVEATPTSDESTLDATAATATKFSFDQIPLNFCGCFDK